MKRVSAATHPPTLPQRRRLAPGEGNERARKKRRERERQSRTNPKLSLSSLSHSGMKGNGEPIRFPEPHTRADMEGREGGGT